MEKLELKRLAGYLPYGLTGEQNEYLDNKKTDLGGFETVQITGIDFQNNKILIRNGCVTQRDSIKPILRPLSDLTKEIEVNGKKFVPTERLREISGAFKPTPDLKNTFSIEFTQDGKNILSFNALCMHVNQLKLFEKLYEWHFDIHGLIEKWLAIDINTLK
ncbi:MAG TPA: hypothetical protein VJ780_06240 [Flavobacterium sp.]|nr:hypothetical protein [Flavobacterium sp.]